MLRGKDDDARAVRSAVILANIDWTAVESIATVGLLIIAYFAIIVPLRAARKNQRKRLDAERKAASAALVSNLQIELSIMTRAALLEASIDPEVWAEKHRAVTDAAAPLAVGVAFGVDYEAVTRHLSEITRAIESLRDLRQQFQSEKLNHNAYANGVVMLIARTYTFTYAPLLRNLGEENGASSIADQGDALGAIAEAGLFQDELLKMLRDELDEVEPVLNSGHINSDAWRWKHDTVASAVNEAIGDGTLRAWTDEYRDKVLETIRIAAESIAAYESVDKAQDSDTVYLQSLDAVDPVLKAYASAIEIYGDEEYAKNVRVQHVAARASLVPGLRVLLRDDVEALRPLLQKRWVDPRDWGRRFDGIRDRAAKDDVSRVMGDRFGALSAAIAAEEVQLLEYQDNCSGNIGLGQIKNAVRTIQGYVPFIPAESYVREILLELCMAVSVTIDLDDPGKAGQLIRSALEARERYEN